MARWVALKILAAHIKEPKEIRNLQYMKDKLENDPGGYGIVHLVDDFLIEGPNGTHHCLVLGGIGPSFELIEQSYIDFHNYGHFLEFGNTEFGNPDYLKVEDWSTNVLANRLLTAVQHMHSLGLCHGGINSLLSENRFNSKWRVEPFLTYGLHPSRYQCSEYYLHCYHAILCQDRRIIRASRTATGGFTGAL